MKYLSYLIAYDMYLIKHEFHSTLPVRTIFKNFQIKVWQKEQKSRTWLTQMWSVYPRKSRRWKWRSWTSGSVLSMPSECTNSRSRSYTIWRPGTKIWRKSLLRWGRVSWKECGCVGGGGWAGGHRSLENI